MKKLLILLFLLPTILFAQKNVVIKLPGNDPGQLKKAYYKIGQAPDSSYVTITSIDGLQVDTVVFNGGTGVLAAPQPIYGQFYSSTEQFASAADSINFVTFDSTYLANGISLVGSDRIYVSSSGKYEFNYILETFSGQNIYTWIRVNGVDVPFSSNGNRASGLLAEQTNSHLLSLNAGDYVQILYTTTYVPARLVADFYFTYPSFPSVKAIIKKIESTGGSGGGSAPQLDVVVKGATQPYFIPSTGITNYVTPSGVVTPMLSSIGGFGISAFDTVILKNLESISASFYGGLNIFSQKNNSYIELSNLKYIPQQQNLSLLADKIFIPQLINCLSAIDIHVKKDTLLNFAPSLKICQSISLTDSFATTVLFPNLTSTQIEISNPLNTLKRFIAPKLSGNYFYGLALAIASPSLEYILLSDIFDNNVTNGGLNFSLNGCALDQGSVDRILISAAAITPLVGTAIYIDLSGGTSSPPSSAGLTAKATLIAAGANVITN